MLYDVFFHPLRLFSQKGHRRRPIPNNPANIQSALASAQTLILRFFASSRAFFFAISFRVGLPPLFTLRFLHSWFPIPNPIVDFSGCGIL
jgi:hypothetical protein